MIKNIAVVCVAVLFGNVIRAQDLSAMLDDLEKEKPKTVFTTATFKGNRIIQGHSIEQPAAGVLEFRISHRFGTLNKGPYEFFGIDNATMRIGVDYGVTNWCSVGFGRNSLGKTYDGFVKFKALRQSTGKLKMPLTVDVLAAMAIKTLKWDNPERKNYFSSRLYYTFQLLIARKFHDRFSLQLMPTLVHHNLVAKSSEPNDIFALGVGGRIKITKRVAITAEYYAVLPPKRKLEGTRNSLSIGFDIETGGHVFQLHVTNSTSMTDHGFISQTTGNWLKGDILFGFNITRPFTIYDFAKKGWKIKKKEKKDKPVKG